MLYYIQIPHYNGGTVYVEEKYAKDSCCYFLSDPFHLENMRDFCGYKDIGQVIDKLVREKRLSQSNCIKEVNHDKSNKSR